MATSFKDDNKRFNQITSELEKLAHSYVLVGFQEGEVTHSEVKGNRRKQPGLSMAQIAAQNEFGTDKIPARPFMRPSFDENRQRISNVILNQYDRIVEGSSTVKKSLDLIGLYVVDLIQKKIASIQSPPNSPKTIAIKKSSKPLIDFGQMIQSVRHKTVVAR